MQIIQNVPLPWFKKKSLMKNNTTQNKTTSNLEFFWGPLRRKAEYKESQQTNPHGSKDKSVGGERQLKRRTAAECNSSPADCSAPHSWPSKALRDVAFPRYRSSVSKRLEEAPFPMQPRVGRSSSGPSSSNLSITLAAVTVKKRRGTAPWLLFCVIFFSPQPPPVPLYFPKPPSSQLLLVFLLCIQNENWLNSEGIIQ